MLYIMAVLIILAMIIQFMPSVNRPACIEKIAIVLLTAPLSSIAGKGHGARGVHHSSTGTSAHASGSHHSRSSRCASCPRNAKGKIKRSREAKPQFERQNPCPSTGKFTGSCPGYVVDHRKALAEGGADEPSNMPVANSSRCQSQGQMVKR
jgi:hypothetical protein